MCVGQGYPVPHTASSFSPQVKATRAAHGKKTFGPVQVDQLYG